MQLELVWNPAMMETGPAQGDPMVACRKSCATPPKSWRVLDVRTESPSGQGVRTRSGAPVMNSWRQPQCTVVPGCFQIAASSWAGTAASYGAL